MNNKPVELYLIGGITGLLGSLLMIATGYLTLFHMQDAYVGEVAQKMAFIVKAPLVGITHGLGVVSLLLMLPTVLAVCALLSTIAAARSLLGTIFGLMWILIELIGHLSQTAPLRALSDLYNQNSQTAIAIFSVLEELFEAFSLTGTFIAVLMSLCYGLVLVDRHNRPSGFLFLIACIAFPVGMAFPQIGIQAHVILRAVAFIIISGVLVQFAITEED